VAGVAGFQRAHARLSTELGPNSASAAPLRCEDSDVWLVGIPRGKAPAVGPAAGVEGNQSGIIEGIAVVESSTYEPSGSDGARCYLNLWHEANKKQLESVQIPNENLITNIRWRHSSSLKRNQTRNCDSILSLARNTGSLK
jgi:hypothetical protein